MFEDIVKKLGLDIEYFEPWIKRDTKFLMHQLKRKVRYNCYCMQRGDIDKVPNAFIEYFEAEHGFQGWKHFAAIWDVEEKHPDVIYQRKFTELEEWEATLRRVVPELPGLVRIV